MQIEIDFTGKLPLSAQEGMARCDANADTRWKAVFDACVLAAARKKPEITSDDVLSELEMLPGAPSTHNLAAIGPAMKRGAQNGIIRPTDRFVRSKVPHKNGNAHLVWRSNYYLAGGSK